MANKILIVEDNEMNRDMLSRRLTRKGYEISIAEDGEVGLNSMRTNRPDLVLMDMGLPVKDGWTATAEAKADPDIASIPIIALTASAGEDSREDSLSAGCTDHISKPIQSIELFEILSRYMKSDHRG